MPYERTLPVMPYPAFAITRYAVLASAYNAAQDAARETKPEPSNETVQNADDLVSTPPRVSFERFQEMASQSKFSAVSRNAASASDLAQQDLQLAVLKTQDATVQTLDLNF